MLGLMNIEVDDKVIAEKQKETELIAELFKGKRFNVKLGQDANKRHHKYIERKDDGELVYFEDAEQAALNLFNEAQRIQRNADDDKYSKRFSSEVDKKLISVQKAAQQQTASAIIEVFERRYSKAWSGSWNEKEDRVKPNDFCQKMDILLKDLKKKHLEAK
jgi:hypothetical protein